MRRRSVIALFVSGTALVGCDEDPTVVREPRPAVIEFFENPVVIEHPETALVGEPFMVAVRTYGDACIERGATSISRTGSRVTIEPMDIFVNQVPAFPCTEILQTFRHEVNLSFDEPGTAEIVVRGIRSVGRDGRVTEEALEVVRTIRVLRTPLEDGGGLDVRKLSPSIAFEDSIGRFSIEVSNPGDAVLRQTVVTDTIDPAFDQKLTSSDIDVNATAFPEAVAEIIPTTFTTGDSIAVRLRIGDLAPTDSFVPAMEVRVRNPRQAGFFCNRVTVTAESENGVALRAVDEACLTRR